MADPKSTSEVQLIARDAVAQQERVCHVKQGHLEGMLGTLTSATQANATAISELAQTVAVLAKSVEPIQKATEDNEAKIDHLEHSVNQLTRRPAFWAAVGSAIPVAARLLWDLTQSKP